MKTFATVKRSAPPARRAPMPVPSPTSAAQRVVVRQILHGSRLQPKLTVGAPDDKFEREADQVADQVMRTPDSEVVDSVTVDSAGSSPVEGRVQRLCQECEGENMRRQPVEEEEDLVQAKERPGSVPQVTGDVAARIRALKGGGQPLPESARSFFDPRFGADFSGVRVHTDSGAEELARTVKARAFTVGRDIVFGQGEYAPNASAGRKLLAHELTHTVQQTPPSTRSFRESRFGRDFADGAMAHEFAHVAQQSGGGGSPAGTVQRTCGSARIGTPAGCTRSPDYGTFVPSHPIYHMDVDCDTLKPGESARLVLDHSAVPTGTRIDVHGFASVDGDAIYNHNLACARALAATDVLTTLGPLGAGIPPSDIDVFNHGPTPGPADDRRSVTTDTTAPPEPEDDRPLCGPDATQWFIDQMNLALTDPAVLAVLAEMAAADAIAVTHGTTAHEVGEGGAAARVLAEEAALTIRSRNPARNPTIDSQLASGMASGVAAGSALRFHPIDTIRIVNHLRNAAAQWTVLVNHAARFDFKAHSDQMNFPREGPCPEDDCPQGEVGIITLCPGTQAENCYQSDLPGNLFFSRIGQFVGFSELILQLGSQFAELTDTVPRPSRPRITWDSPEDTAAIHVASALPLPLTRTALCSMLATHRSTLSHRAGCKDCTTPTTAVIR